MKEGRLQKIEKASKERDMLIKMISLFKYNEDYYGRLEFFDRNAIGTISDKVVFVLEERLKEEEDYLRHLLENKEVKFTPKKRNDMKALFNCSVIKNVYLRIDLSPIELEITYTDNPNESWISRKSIDKMCDKSYHKGKYEEAYNTIKQALLNNDKFVEIEI